jgi:ribosomal protein S8
METSLIGKALDFGSSEYRFESCVSNMIQREPNEYVISHINLALTKKLHSTTIVYSRRTLNIVNILYRVGVIHRFFILNKPNSVKRIRFTVFFYKSQPFFKSIRLVSSSSKKYTLTLKSLILLKRSLKSSILILSTSKGILTHNEAIKHKIGGLGVCLVS